MDAASKALFTLPGFFLPMVGIALVCNCSYTLSLCKELGIVPDRCHQNSCASLHMHALPCMQGRSRSAPILGIPVPVVLVYRYHGYTSTTSIPELRVYRNHGYAGTSKDVSLFLHMHAGTFKICSTLVCACRDVALTDTPFCMCIHGLAGCAHSCRRRNEQSRSTPCLHMHAGTVH